MDNTDGDVGRCMNSLLKLVATIFLMYANFFDNRPSRTKRAKTRYSGDQAQQSQGAVGGHERSLHQSGADGQVRSVGLKWPTADEDRESFDGNYSGEEHDQGEGHKGRGCRCGRTKCLKQYCQCFRNDHRCTPECLCSNCHNDGKHEEIRLSAVRHIRMNNTTAFKGTALEVINFEVRTPRGSVHTVRGCRCRRSKCQKKYCECFSAGLACTNNCVCVDCANGNTLSSSTDDKTAADVNAEYSEPEVADRKPSRAAAHAAGGKVGKGVPPAQPAPSTVSTRRQRESTTSFKEETAWEQGYPGTGSRFQAPAEGSGASGGTYLHANGSNQPDPVIQALHSRPPLGPSVGAGTRAAAAVTAGGGGGASSRRKPSISVQVPVAAFSKGSVIPLSGPMSSGAASGSGSAGRHGSSGADSAREGDDGDQQDDSYLMGQTPSGDPGIQLQTPKSEFGTGMGSGASRSLTEGFGWKGPGQSPFYASGLTPAAPPSASSAMPFSDWSPREGLRSRRQSVAGTGGSAGGSGRFAVPSFPGAGGSSNGGGSSSFSFGGGGFGDGGSASGGLFSAGLSGGGLTPFGGGQTPSFGGGGSGLTPFGGGDSPAPYTRSRSGNLASAVLHRNTPPTSPSTWGAEPLLGDPLQDPDAILPAPLSSRAWMNRDRDAL